MCHVRTKCFVLTLGLICFFTLPSLAQSQRYSGTFRNENVRVVLESIQKSTGVKFVYNAALINNSNLITTTAKDETVDSFLRRILTPIGIDFVWQDGVAVLRRKVADANNKKINISGYVNDSENYPLVGVSVMVVGTTIGATTDSQGKYTICANQDCAIKFSFIGMESQIVPCNHREIIDVVLKEDVRVMEDAVVTGYQTIHRSQLTSAVTTLKMDDIRTPGVTTLDQMIEGRIPGMIFMKNSGQVGAAPKLRIRGTSTILGNREPLWVLDGIVLADPVNVDPQQINDPDFVNLLGNAISGLNPDDIEQIDVLKDASATALYGAKAGNGVIVISTKKGKTGRPTISYSGTGTFTSRPHYSDRSIYMMNSAERMDVSKELVDRKMYYNNITQWSGYEQAIQDYYRGKITYAEFKSQSDYYASINTDWLGMLCKNVFSNNHTLSLSGGTANIKYYASLGYSNENGVIKGEKNNRYSTTLNVTGNYGKFNVQFSLLGNYSEREYLPADLGVMNYAYNMSRTMPAYNSDGSLFYYPRTNSSGLIYNYNIMNEIKNSGDASTGNGLNMRTQIRYNVLPYLNIDGLLSYNIANNTRETYYTKDTYHTFNLRGDQTERWDLCPVGGEYSRSENTNNSYTGRLQANYTKLLGASMSHLITASAGIEIKSTENKGFDMTRRGYFTDYGGYFDMVPTKYSGYYNQWMATKPALGFRTRQLNNELAWYATAGYGWKDRYLFNIHLRGEQSNLFGSRANNEFMPIWALSGRWNMKKDVLKDVSWIDDISVRASWGWQGNMLPGQTSRMIMQMSTLTNNIFNSGYANISKYPNPDLRWERTSSSNLSVDFALFNNKIRGSVAYFYKHTSDAFLTKTISEINGINQYVVNGGTLENQGFELSLSFTPIDNANLGGTSRGFVWRLDPQIGQVLNKVLNRAINNKTHVLRDEITYNDFLSGNVELSGKPISTFYSYRYKGLSKVDGSPLFYGCEDELSQEYMQKYATMKREDVYMAVMEESGAREPYIQGGISNYFGYRNFGLSFNLTYSLGNKVRLMKICSGYATNVIYPQQNLRKEFTERWRKPGDELYTDIPGLSSNNTVNTPWWNVYPATAYSFGGTVYDMYDNSNLRVVSGDYLKLQSLSFRYNVSEKITKKIGVQSAYISLSGTNLFTICNSKLKGQDPTQSGSTPNINIAVQPTYSLNINFTL